MLNEIERLEIEAEIQKVPRKNAACIEALKVILRHRKWVSDESIADVAVMLEMSAGEVDAVATFYNLIFRKPVGRNIILICDSISCWVMGYENIKKSLMDNYGLAPGETSMDERFTLLPNVCLGCCDHAPAMIVNEDLHKDLSPDKISLILEKYI